MWVCVATIGVVRFSVRGFGCALFILKTPDTKNTDREHKILGLFNIKSVFLDVNVQLIVGYFYSLLIKRLLDGFKNVEIDRPVVAAVYPDTGNQIDTAGAVLRNAHHGRGILEHQLV